MTLKKFFRFAALLGLVLLSSSLVAQQTSSDSAMTNQHNLMPIPASVQFGSGKLSIDGGFRVALSQPDLRVQAACERFLKRLQGRTGLTFAATVSNDTAGSSLVIQFQGPGKSIPSLDEDESYKLEVTANKAQLTAPTAIGAIRGLETVLQLVSSDRDGYFLPIVSVQDQPRFRWRGLLIDIGRHYEPPDVLKRNLDAMAAVKLNVFHWHLTEDQGFRIESKKFPKLHQLGSDGLFYTQEQAREIIEYARQRGIRVVPEFDIPGHSTSWLVGHPELGSAPGPFSIERRAGIFEPALDPTREEVYKFLDTFLGEMAALFPDDYLHIGGDENEGKQWDRNAKIQAFMKQKGIKDNHALQAYFNQRLLKILEKHKKKMIGWDEILRPEIPTTAVIHSWRGTTALAEAARKGYSGILSNGYYIDLSFPTSQHYLVDPIPADTTLTIEEQQRILGGEATMWGEYVGPETIDSRIWPRTAAIAERLWSPQNTRDVDDMYRRLNVITVQLEELGLTHERNVDVLLRRLAGQKEIGSLKLLVSQVEPVKEYRRGEQRASTMLSPLTGFVDAARPDSESARKIARMVDALLSDAPKFQPYASDLKTTFAQWSDAEAQLNPIVDRNPALHEIRPLTRDFSAMGNAGLEALAYLSRNEAAPQDWFESKRTALDEAAKPKAALEFPVVSSVRALVVAAAELQQLKTMTPADWKKLVITKATVTPTK
ncbi:MAG TPA: family 20 glycosylhydrolase [Pyrinomonadaceae bacterium]|nr:family 20 glycosylhydrolase [Pyrinomonadaceae bacterium]